MYFLINAYFIFEAVLFYLKKMGCYFLKIKEINIFFLKKFKNNLIRNK